MILQLRRVRKYTVDKLVNLCSELTNYRKTGRAARGTSDHLKRYTQDHVEGLRFLLLTIIIMTKRNKMDRNTPFKAYIRNLLNTLKKIYVS